MVHNKLCHIIKAFFKKKIKQNILPAKKNPKCIRRLLHWCHKNVCTFNIMLFECEMLEGYHLPIIPISTIQLYCYLFMNGSPIHAEPV
jgi:hypothetical protein